MTTSRSRLAQPIGGAPAWTIVLLAAAAITLVPWTIVLATQLPAHHVARHWDVAWAGFDAGLVAVLVAALVAALQGSVWFPGLALASAALLVCDAWFDIVTAAGGNDLWLAVLTAVFPELPLVAVCVIAARSAMATSATQPPDHAGAEPRSSPAQRADRPDEPGSV